MKIKKIYQGTAPENKILNTQSDSQTDVYSCNYINKLNTYSTEETVIGTWIDGKTLYKKTITTNQFISGGTTTSIEHGIQNVEKIWIDTSDSFMFDGSNSYPFPVNQYGSYNNFDRLGVKVNQSTIDFLSAGGWDENWEKVITVKYTKKTD